VGRYFSEHLQVFGGFAALSTPPEELSLFTGVDVDAPQTVNETNTASARAILTLTPGAQQREGLLGLEAQVLVSDPSPAGPTYEHGVTASDVGRLIEAEGETHQATAFLQLLAEQELNAASRVKLGTTTDALGMPRVELDWRHTALDRASIVRGSELMAAEFGRLGLGRMQLTPGDVLQGDGSIEDPLTLYRVDHDGAEFGDFPLGIGFHHMCPTRMADDPSQGVVDSNCRVHGINNLFVAGSAVFSSGGVATPTFTITALAIRLAEHIETSLLPQTT
jgi:choline dehydrogenase-like flavoprotein